MAQKLLLFWRKPARRCWWEGVELDNVDGVEGKLKVWIRRVWTLEMVSPLMSNCSVKLTVNAERHRLTIGRYFRAKSGRLKPADELVEKVHTINHKGKCNSCSQRVTPQYAFDMLDDSVTMIATTPEGWKGVN